MEVWTELLKSINFRFCFLKLFQTQSLTQLQFDNKSKSNDFRGKIFRKNQFKDRISNKIQAIKSHTREVVFLTFAKHDEERESSNQCE